MSDAAPRKRSRLSLRGLLPSPMLAKELVQLATSRRVFGLRSGFVGLLTLVAMLILLTDTSLMESEGAGIDFTLGVGWLLLLLILLVTPVLTAGLINGEREANTMSLLFLTRLSFLNIVQDKGLSRIMLMLLLAAMAVPFLFAGLLFGGVDDQQVILIAATWANAIFVAGGLGLFCSSRIARPASALVVTYTLIVAWLLGSALAVTPATYLALGLSDQPLEEMREAMGYRLLLVNPVAMLQAVTAELKASSSYDLGPKEAILQAGVGILLYLAAVIVAAWDLRRLAKAGASGRPRSGLSVGALLRPLRVLHPAHWMQRASQVSGNPYRWRSADTMTDSLRRTITTLALVMMALAAAALLLGRWQDGAWPQDATHYRIVYVITVPIGLLVMLILGATVFTRERHAMTWDVLLSTRLAGQSIVWGAAADLLRYCLLLFALPAAAILVAGRLSPQVVGLPPLLFLMLYSVLLVLTCLRVSLTSRSNARAVAKLLLLTAAVCLLPLIVAWILHVVLGSMTPMKVLLAQSQSPAYWLFAAGERDTWTPMRNDRPALIALLVHLGVLGCYSWWLLTRLGQFDALVGRQATPRRLAKGRQPDTPSTEIDDKPQP